MKSILTVAIALFLALPAAAQKTEPDRDEDRLARFLEKFPESDANRDGKLTVEEVRAFNRERRPARNDRPPGPPPTHADVVYGDHPRQRFDIWLADSPDGAPTPLCIYIHGGGFRGGDKSSHGGAMREFLARGVSFAALNYRLTEGGKNPYPIPMHDAARALQFIRSQAEDWNLDPDRIACYGGSAGAGISLWLAFHDDLADPDADDPVARQSTRIVAAGASNGQSTYDMRTFKEWFGIPDLEPHPALVDFYAVKEDGDWASVRVKELMADASAITHLTVDDAPVFMIYGRGDVPVTKESDAGVWVHHVQLGLKLKDAMENLGMECVVTYPGHPPEKYGGMSDFLIRKVKGE